MIGLSPLGRSTKPMSQIPSPYVITVSQHSYAYTVLEQNSAFMNYAPSCFLHKSIKRFETSSQKMSPRFPSLCRPDVTHYFRIKGYLVFSIISPPNNFLHRTEPHFAFESESNQTWLMIKLLLCHYFWSLFH